MKKNELFPRDMVGLGNIRINTLHKGDDDDDDDDDDNNNNTFILETLSTKTGGVCAQELDRDLCPRS
jgi:hypothetical protein